MSEKTLNNIRIVHKHDTEENWLKATNFIPKQGELIIYDIDDTYTYQRFKIGDGVNLVSDLPFGSSDSAVLYTEQELTENQQMQARKNQGLYYQQKIYNTTLENVEFVDGQAIIDYPPVTNSSKEAAIVQIDMIDSSGNIQYSFMGNEVWRRYSTANIEEWTYSGEEKNGNYTHSLEMGTVDTDNAIITFSTNSALETSFTTNLVFYEIELKQVEEEYIPSTIARVSDLESKADISLVTEVEAALYNTIAENNLLISDLETEVDTKANQTDLDTLEDLVGTTSVQSQISSAIADLVDSAPETLDTLSELATAIQENDSIIDTLDAAITQKADKADLEATNTKVAALQSQVLTDSLILVDAITGDKYTIQIQNGQLVSFPVEESN